MMNTASQNVIVSGSFDNISSDDMRFLQESALLGSLKVALWSDDLIRRTTRHDPKFIEQERLYTLESVRCVDAVEIIGDPYSINIQPNVSQSVIFAVRQKDGSPRIQEFCKAHRLVCRVIGDDQLTGFPAWDFPPSSSSLRKKVLVTGCFDWFHSGHVRFFEECSELGDLYVVVGHDQNLRELKGPGHPLFGQDHRLYMVGAVRYVHCALISTGHGWMDAEPEVDRLQPDMYVVNEDGDKPVKRQFCQARGIQYVVLKRLPRPGLPRRTSTNLRGF